MDILAIDFEGWQISHIETQGPLLLHVKDVYHGLITRKNFEDLTSMTAKKTVVARGSQVKIDVPIASKLVRTAKAVKLDVGRHSQILINVVWDTKNVVPKPVICREHHPMIYKDGQGGFVVCCPIISTVYALNRSRNNLLI